MPTLSSASNTTMTATSIASRLGAMQLNSKIPVPTMVTRSLATYTGPYLLTALPTELMQNVVSNLDAKSIQALRITNKAAAAKCHFSYVKTNLHSLKIDMTKIGMRRGLTNLKQDFVSETTKQVTFATSSTHMGTLTNGARRGARVNSPAKGDLDAILHHMPNVTAIVVRDTSYDNTIFTTIGYGPASLNRNSLRRDTRCNSVVPQSVCTALAAALRTNLRDLTIDGCSISAKTLKSLLLAHRKTLRYLVLRDVIFTDRSFTHAFLKTLAEDFCLDRFVLDGVRNNGARGKLFEVYKATALNIVGVLPTEWDYFMVHEHECEDCHKFQRYCIIEFTASMTGHAGVQQGIAKILAVRGL